MGEPSLDKSLSEAPSERRLDSWKDIALYLHRDVTTVQRWERQEAMPVHRHLHQKRGSVYALSSELEAWQQSRKLDVEEEVNGAVQTPPPTVWRTYWHRAVFRLATFGAVAIVTLAIVLLGLNVHGWRDRILARKPKIQALAVLPLVNLSDDPQQEYIADGMTEALITELGGISGPRVISRQSVMRYKGSKKSLQEIARELNVDAVLEGAVEPSGDRVKVTLHLEQASPERQLWAQKYDRSMRDVLSLQDEIAHAVADGIQFELSPQERARLSRPRSVNPEAYADYLRGRSITSAMYVTPLAEQDIERAILYFKQAIGEDPGYAQAYAGLAYAYILLGNPLWASRSPKEALSEARAAAGRALELDPSLPYAHFSLAQSLEYEWNWPEAEKQYKLALNLNPYDAVTHLEYGRFVQAVGENDEAMTQVRYAAELDPLDIFVKGTQAYVTYVSRQYDVALKLFQGLDDDHGLVWAYREKGMYPEAIAAWERWIRSDPSLPQQPHSLATLAGIYGLQGNNDKAEALIKKLKEQAHHRYVSGFFFAEAYTGLGQRDQAINWLERAYQERDEWMVFGNSYPGLDPLRSEPRFQALMRRMNFPQ